MSPIELLRFTVGPFEENPYLLVGPSGRRAAVVDPGLGSEVVLDAATRRGLSIELIVNTHGHLDHAAGNRYFKEKTGAPIAIHPADVPFIRSLAAQGAMYGIPAEDSPEPDLALAEGTPLRFDGIEIAVIHTPGHTPGGVCLGFDDRLIVGDTLFRGSVGRTDLPGGDWETLVDSIRRKLFARPDSTVCYPGHGPETTIGFERRSNPFVSDAAARRERA